jgi:hypothetical protein
MKSDPTYQSDIESIWGTQSYKEQKELEKRMGFSYRQRIGELIYALTVCQVDISIAVRTLTALQLMAQYWAMKKGSFFYGGISP